MSIYVSTDFREKLFFERWQDMAIGYVRGQTGMTAGLFDIGYYNNTSGTGVIGTGGSISSTSSSGTSTGYVGTVQIQQYDNLGNTMNTCTLVEAYPISVTSMEKSWDHDTVDRLSVTWAYRYFNDDTYSNPNGSTSSSTTG